MRKSADTKEKGANHPKNYRTNPRRQFLGGIRRSETIGGPRHPVKGRELIRLYLFSLIRGLQEY